MSKIDGIESTPQMPAYLRNLGYLLFLLLLMFPGDTSAWQNNEVESVILQGSKLRINGTSNVNDFECVYDEEFESDTLHHMVQVEEAVVEVGGDELALEIDSFDCGKKGINRDFRNTLKSEVYPNIRVELLKVYRKNTEPVQAEVSISLAGISNTYIVKLQEIMFKERVTQIGGTQTIKMSDYNLSPPRALFGLVKVRDELDINFTLRIKQ